MASLAVRCKGCGAQVFSGIRTGPVARPLMGARTLACRGCGASASYHGADFRVAEPALPPGEDARAA